jgi:chromate transporter
MILLKLFWMFFKIGLFSFGGGYAMIPLIQKELEINGWVDPKEFADIVAISQMTPGPIAVNAATYIGVKVAGVAGSAIATLGVSLPSFILIIIVAKFVERFKESHAIQSVLSGIRPVTIGLISSAVIFFAMMSIITSNPIALNPGALTIFAVTLVLVKKFKIHPILTIILSGIMGMVLL